MCFSEIVLIDVTGTNTRWKNPKGKSRIDHPETLATMGTQDT